MLNLFKSKVNNICYTRNKVLNRKVHLTISAKNKQILPTLSPTIKLNNGQKIPVLGLGTWRSYESEAEQAVKYAIDVGYRHIDTAFIYKNEHEIGSAIRSKISEGTIKREQLFVVTKLSGIHHEPKLVEYACRKSLTNLGLDYIDLYLMHFPVAQTYKNDEDVSYTTDLTNVDFLETWNAMEELVNQKLVNGIGISNFNAAQTERIMKFGRIKPAVNQVECHPCFNQRPLIEFSRECGILITAYCPLARPQPHQEWPPFLYDTTAQRMAAKYEKKPAQISLRYLLQLGTVPIPKSVSQKRIAENFDIFDFELSATDMKTMEKYHTGKRINPFTIMSDHKYYPFKDKF